MNKGGTLTNATKDKEANNIVDYAQGLHPRDNIDRMYQEKKVKEDSPALRIALMHQHKESRTKSKRAKINCSNPYKYINTKKKQ